VLYYQAYPCQRIDNLNHEIKDSLFHFTDSGHFI